MKQKFELIKALDDIRWSTKNGLDRFYFETDYYCFDVKNFITENKKDTEITCEINDKKIAEKILLSHYLIYITNRQMDYRHIFKAGAYVLSKIAEDFLNSPEDYTLKNACLLEGKQSKDKPENESKNKLYFKVDAPENAEKGKNKDIYDYFEAKGLSIKNKENNKNEVKFSSRFITTDFLCVHKTLEELKNTYNGSFTDFLKENCEDFTNLAEAMYKLTYKNIPQISIKEETMNYDEFIKNVKEPKDTSSKKKFDKHGAKRIWCVIRDYMYHPIFSACFKTIIGDKKFDDLNKILVEVELPGDVWNNNKKFAECFLSKKRINTKTFNSSKFVRKQYDKDIWGDCLPVHFDITFSFVPQLCMNDECDNFCPFNENSKEEFKQFCHKQEGNICTFVLYATGIKHKCLGESECDILKILTNNQNEN